MLKVGIKEVLPKRWRLRMKAGALALFFAFLTLLPWAHVITLGGQSGHACCHHDVSGLPAGDAPILASSAAAACDSCWVCDSLASLHHPTVLADLLPLAQAFFSSAFFARPPQAPSYLNIYPASRSQAPPVRA